MSWTDNSTSATTNDDASDEGPTAPAPTASSLPQASITNDGEASSYVDASPAIAGASLPRGQLTVDEVFNGTAAVLSEGVANPSKVFSNVAACGDMCSDGGLGTAGDMDGDTSDTDLGSRLSKAEALLKLTRASRDDLARQLGQTKGQVAKV